MCRFPRPQPSTNTIIQPFSHDGDVGRIGTGCVLYVLVCAVLWSNSGNSVLRSRSADAFGSKFSVACLSCGFDGLVTKL
jgi:hypothetical protein